jgi:hypothetical protein
MNGEDKVEKVVPKTLTDPANPNQSEAEQRCTRITEQNSDIAKVIVMILKTPTLDLTSTTVTFGNASGDITFHHYLSAVCLSTSVYVCPAFLKSSWNVLRQVFFGRSIFL